MKIVDGRKPFVRVIISSLNFAGAALWIHRKKLLLGCHLPDALILILLRRIEMMLRCHFNRLIEIGECFSGSKSKIRGFYRNLMHLVINGVKTPHAL
jgi:hypothetical protein